MAAPPTTSASFPLIPMVVFNELYEFLDSDGSSAVCEDAVVCHCLQITESTLRDAAAVCPFRSLSQISRETGAGSGCTACHRRLRRFID